MRIIPLQQRIEAFVRLGRYLAKAADDNTPGDVTDHPEHLQNLIESRAVASAHNPWFIAENINYALQTWTEALTEQHITEWLVPYSDELKPIKEPRKVAVVMAGNIPAVGFHDLLCVLAAGDTVKVKLSSSDQLLIPSITRCLTELEPAWNNRIEYVTETLSGFDAVIATGNDNTARYFEYYFGKYPHIIRKNRTSVAVLTGHETPEELELLAEDVFQYFGLGCRNVTKLYVPQGYDFVRLLDAFRKYNHLADHHKLKNNYDYNLALHILNKKFYMTNGSILLVEADAVFSPISQLNYEFYKNADELMANLAKSEEIQCITGKGHIPFGSAQCPSITDYADGVDTLDFLKNL